MNVEHDVHTRNLARNPIRLSPTASIRPGPPSPVIATAGAIGSENFNGHGRKSGGSSHGGRSASPAPSATTTTLSGRRISVAAPSVASVVPLKRKHTGNSRETMGRDKDTSEPHINGTLASTSAPTDDAESSESIRCICGFSNDDGWSIGCDGCGRWVHGVCFGIDLKDKENLPDKWLCWECDPRPLDREKATRIQRVRLGLDQPESINGHHRRRTSPGVERKPRRITMASNTHPSSGNPSNNPSSAIDGSLKRKRRASMSMASPLAGEDELVDIDEPWTHSYVEVNHDSVPEPDIREKLRRQASEWRGITAISPAAPSQEQQQQPGYPFFDTTPVHSQFLPPTKPPVSLHSIPLNPLLPPSYGVHATLPIPSSSFISPFPSTITSSATYLADPLNAYAHLGLPKPFVHLVGPPLDLSLDARQGGGKARFVRSGCRPNAVLRPVLCDGASAKSWAHANARDADAERRAEDRDTTLSFGIFALRDLKAGEEVVLGWEWDDSNAVHELPALIDEPNRFPRKELAQYRLQMANILRGLSSTFTTCACGATAKDCALKKMQEFVEGDQEQRQREQQEREWERERERQRNQTYSPRTPYTPFPPMPMSADTPRPSSPPHLPPTLRSAYPDAGESPGHRSTSFSFSAPPAFPVDRARPTPVSTGLDVMDVDDAAAGTEPVAGPSNPRKPTDLGPLVGRPRGFRTREKVPGTGGLSGVEMVPPGKERQGPGSGSDRDEVRDMQEDDLRANQARSSRSTRRPRVHVDTGNVHGTHYPPPSYPPPHHPFHSPYFSPMLHHPPHDPYSRMPYPYLPPPSHAPVPSFMLSPASPSPRRRSSSSRKHLFWGEAAPYRGKGKERAVSDGNDSAEVDIEGVEVEGIASGTESETFNHSQPQRHRRKRSTHVPTTIRASYHPPDPGTMESVEREALAVEVEVPPKMKRRWMQQRKEDTVDSSSGEGSAVGLNDVEERRRDSLYEERRHPSRGRSVSHESPAPPSLRASWSSSTKTTPPPPPAEPVVAHPEPPISSPLMSLANLSLLSPAILLPHGSNRSTSRPLTSSLWDSNLPYTPSAEPTPPYRNPAQLSPPAPMPASGLGDLAALAAAAAAARPISPLPERRWAQSPSTLAPPAASDTSARSVSPSESETHSQRDAVLGPGGIRVLSSPEHDWAPLRRAKDSATRMGEESDRERSLSNTVLDIRGSVPLDDPPDDDAFATQQEEQLVPDDKGAASRAVKLEMIEEDMASSNAGVELLTGRSPIVELADVRDEVVVARAVSPCPASVRAGSASQAMPNEDDMAVDPLVDESPDNMDVDDTAERIPSRPVSSAASRSDLSTPAILPHPRDLDPSPASPSDMSALSSALSSPVVLPTAMPAVDASSPLSSPLSSPVENLRSLPEHSAPDLHNVEMTESEHSDEPSVATSSDIPPPSVSDIPPLEHSTSMSPVQSPRDISPTTPSETSMEVDVVAEVQDNPKSPSVIREAPANREEVSVQPTVREPEEVSATPLTPTPAPSKVKMSLKDFAMRKKRQREEEERERSKQEEKKLDAEPNPDDSNDIIAESSAPADSTAIQEEPSATTSLAPPLPLMDSAIPNSPVSKPTVDANSDCEASQKQSDVDVITKVSETLNKLIQNSSVSKPAINGDLSSKPILLPPSSPKLDTPKTTVIIQSPAPIINPSPRAPTPPVVTPPRAQSPEHAQHEDGEIEDNPSPSPPPKRLYPSSLSSRPPPPAARLLNTKEPRSRTPPTQPRSFISRSPSVSLPHGSPPTRSLNLNGSAPVPSPAPVNPALGRTPPSGPRALRQQQNGGYLGSRIGLARATYGGNIDRDRDREHLRDRGNDFGKDREWRRVHRLPARDWDR